MAKKDLFIHAVQQVEVDDSKNIPTAVYYEAEDKYLIGYEALAVGGDVLEINQDFKVDLGRHDSLSGRQSESFPTACGTPKSAYVMASDFITRVLREVSRWLAVHQIEEAAHLLIAEPLAMHEEQDTRWLENYRRNLREILSGRKSSDFPNVRIEEVSFLPEPFAAFQYYRYGINHPLMSQAGKHQALILDFGGGTFDVCVVETTKEGDISRTGRNSKPFGASSTPVGGFFVNRKIAEYLYRQHVVLPSRKDQFKQGLKLYDKWRRNEQDLLTMRDEYRAFVLNFHRTSFEVEAPKISLCKQLTNWGLEATVSGHTKVRLPADPFLKDSTSKSVPFSATEMRDVFLSAVWKEKLKPTVKLCLERAAEDLEGQPITIVLLSGGSANIGWLEAALLDEFSGVLGQAQVLPLPDFQEVVSKGLAVECARRFYSESGAGDFGSVVYNRLCLMLDVNKTHDSSDCRPRPFRPMTPMLPNPEQPGVLLQSATAIQAFLDHPMRWRVGQLGAQPKKLDYYFLRSSLDPDDIENRLNFEETAIKAPPRCRFDQDLKIELVVREDGTAVPTFIYHLDQDTRRTVAVKGHPFALDVTYGVSSPNAKAYIGFDFGTSNSSVSFVESRSVKEYERRRSDDSWRELSDLAYKIPYPAADPLLAYLAETTNRERLNNTARQAFEAMLALVFYVVVVDYRWFRQREGRRDQSKLFGSLNQRSAGPLWAGLRQLFTQQGFDKKASFTAPVAELFEADTAVLMNSYVDFIAQAKHDKSETGSVDAHRPLTRLANVCNRIFQRAMFGFFENVRAERFSKDITGHFRIADGPAPFIKGCDVRLTGLVAEMMPYLLVSESSVALPLSPMIFWWQDPRLQLFDHGFCYLFDYASKDALTFSFKIVGRADHLTVSKDSGETSALVPDLIAARTSDGPIETIDVNIITGADEA